MTRAPIPDFFTHDPATTKICGKAAVRLRIDFSGPRHLNASVSCLLTDRRSPNFGKPKPQNDAHPEASSASCA
jgi:hypothetical protein